METKSLKSFIYLEDGSIDYSVLDVIEVSKKLKPGFYSLRSIRTMEGTKFEIHQEKLPDYSTSQIKYKELEDFKTYLTKFKNDKMKEKMHSLGYKHKIGVLLYGKQGTGKTVFTSYMARDIIKEGGVAFNMNLDEGTLSQTLDFLKSLRQVQDERFIFIFDECEDLLKNYESTCKNFLDGYNSIDNSISVFTTNYIDKIPKTIYERPSRIRFTIELKGISDERTISDIIESSLNRKATQKEIKKLMNKTIDEIKEHIVDEIFEYSEEKTETKGIGFN